MTCRPAAPGTCGTGRTGEQLKVLITGGSGYIGSAVALACKDAGITPVILDVNADIHSNGMHLARGHISDGRLIDKVYEIHPDIYACIHCAALTGVPESAADPLRYYGVNVAQSLQLAGHLIRNGCRRLIFSSSAAVYAPGPVAVSEDSLLGPQSPYARTKLACEQLLADLLPLGLRTLSLRYFNPIGADPQLRTGPARPAHVLGKMMEAQRTGEPFVITGTDWETRDGTGLRDYVHVWDLAAAHVDAVIRFDTLPVGVTAVNLGTGQGTTVRELLAYFQEAAGPVRVMAGDRRRGDVAGAYAVPGLAWEVLGWRAVYPVSEAVGHAVQWRNRMAASGV